MVSITRQKTIKNITKLTLIFSSCKISICHYPGGNNKKLVEEFGKKCISKGCDSTRPFYDAILEPKPVTIKIKKTVEKTFSENSEIATATIKMSNTNTITTPQALTSKDIKKPFKSTRDLIKVNKNSSQVFSPSKEVSQISSSSSTELLSKINDNVSVNVLANTSFSKRSSNIYVQVYTVGPQKNGFRNILITNFNRDNNIRGEVIPSQSTIDIQNNLALGSLLETFNNHFSSTLSDSINFISDNLNRETKLKQFMLEYIKVKNIRRI